MTREVLWAIAILCAGPLALGCGADDDGDDDSSGDDCGLQDCGFGACGSGIQLEIDGADLSFAAEDVECVMETAGCGHHCFEFAAEVEEPAFAALEFLMCFTESEGGEPDEFGGMVWAEDEDGEYGDYAWFDCFFFTEQDGTFSGNFSGQCGYEEPDIFEFSGCFEGISCEENHYPG